jgi:L-threonylcarbamoyladenylate synthase
MVVSKDNPAAARRAAAVLARGGVAVLPCDTIYGLVGIAPETEARLRSIKGRGEDRPFLMLIGDPAWMAPFTGQPLPPALAPFWPGELTIVCRARGTALTAAFRQPRDPFLREVLALASKPLYSTSVNRSGGPHLWRIDDIVGQFEDEVDVIVAAGDLPEGVPSTVLDLTTRPWTVVRQGTVVIPPSVLEESAR